MVCQPGVLLGLVYMLWSWWAQNRAPGLGRGRRRVEEHCSVEENETCSGRAVWTRIGVAEHT